MKRKSSIQNAIDQAFLDGGDRKPQHFQILVHPAYPWSQVGVAINEQYPQWKKIIAEWHCTYTSAIKQVLTAHPDTSVVIRESDASLHSIFPDANFCIDGHHRDNGYLTRAGMRTLLEWMQGVNPEDRVSIHGSGWKFCPNEFAFQWSVLKHLKVFAPFKVQRNHPYIARLSQQLKRLMQGNMDDQIIEGVQHNTSYSPYPNKQAYAKQDGHIIIPDPKTVQSMLPNKALSPLDL